KDRSRRYETASGLARDIERYLAGDTVEACPPTMGYQLRKFYRRYRAAVWTAGAFAAVLLAAVAVSLVFGVMAKRAEAEADRRRWEADANAKLAGQNALTAKENELRAKGEAAKVKAEQERTRRVLHASEINHAFLDALEFRTARMQDRLAGAKPKPGEPDLRSWDWHYLDVLT